MMRKVARAAPSEIETDFERRVLPGLRHCQRVGNIMGATLLLALASTIDHAGISATRRIGCFAYGSGCCSEFFSGVVTPDGQRRLRQLDIGTELDRRYHLSMDEYETLLRDSSCVRFGTRSVVLDPTFIPGARQSRPGHQKLFLKEIRDFHRKYEWV